MIFDNLRCGQVIGGYDVAQIKQAPITKGPNNQRNE